MEFIHQVAPSIDDHEVSAMTAYLRSGGWLTEFEKTQEFERRIAEAVGAKYASAVNNGTISLTLGLLALGIKPGDEVLVPNFTMIASPNAATLIGAKPILVDINPEDLCLDLEEAKRKITPQTRAIMYVNLNGRGKFLPEFATLCRERGLHLMEDAAQAMGSQTAGRFHGTFGEVGSFSFSPHKIITTGQGGALVTDDETLYNRIEKLKDFGRSKGGADFHDEFGINSKFTDVQAVLGIEQLKKLPDRIRRKKEIYATYEKLLSGLPAVEFIPTDLAQTTPWFVDIYVKEPDALQKHLKSENIGTRRVYPPVHSQKLFGLRESFSITQSYCSRGLWLPSSLTLTNEQIALICSKIGQFLSGREVKAQPPSLESATG